VSREPARNLFEDLPSGKVDFLIKSDRKGKYKFCFHESRIIFIHFLCWETTQSVDLEENLTATHFWKTPTDHFEFFFFKFCIFFRLENGIDDGRNGRELDWLFPGHVEKISQFACAQPLVKHERIDVCSVSRLALSVTTSLLYSHQQSPYYT
jgi:hypothetical protein